MALPILSSQVADLRETVEGSEIVWTLAWLYYNMPLVADEFLQTDVWLVLPIPISL
jgi:hypothetical protein